MKLSGGPVEGMDGDLGGRESKDQPTFTDVDGTESQNIPKERAVGFRILAVEEEMSAGDHGASLLDSGSNRRTAHTSAPCISQSPALCPEASTKRISDFGSALWSRHAMTGGVAMS